MYSRKRVCDSHRFYNNYINSIKQFVFTTLIPLATGYYFTPYNNINIYVKKNNSRRTNVVQPMKGMSGQKPWSTKWSNGH